MTRAQAGAETRARVGSGPASSWTRAWRLLTAAPVLRLSWIAAAVFTIACATVLSLVSYPGGTHPVLLHLAPLLPVAGGAASYGPGMDPAYELTLATPFSGFRLLLLRTVTVPGVTVPLLLLTSFAIPTAGVSAVAWLLPTLALVLVTLALGGRVEQRLAAGVVGGGWTAVFVPRALAVVELPLVFGAPAQWVWAAGAVRAAGCCSCSAVSTIGWRGDMTTVSVDGLRARYGSRLALDGISLHMGAGVHGVLGPNGAGKTTLMRTLATVMAPGEGKVHLLGYDVSRREDRTEARRRLGYLPQTFGYYRGFTVAEFVEYIAWLKQMPKERVPGAVDRAVARVGLADRARSKLKTLSGGMLRRAGIAQAIVNDPDVLLLDEPTAGLDPEQRVEFRELLRGIGATGTVIVSTHLVEDVAAACTEVTLLDAGRLVFTGTPGQLEDLGDSAAARGRASGDSALERGYSAALRRAREATA